MSGITRGFLSLQSCHHRVGVGRRVVCVKWSDQSGDVTAGDTGNNAVTPLRRTSENQQACGWGEVTLRKRCRRQRSHSHVGIEGRVEDLTAKTKPHRTLDPSFHLKYSTCSDICVPTVLTAPNWSNRPPWKRLKSNQICLERESAQWRPGKFVAHISEVGVHRYELFGEWG